MNNSSSKPEDTGRTTIRWSLAYLVTAAFVMIAVGSAAWAALLG